jgi:hypothetical protein
VLVDDPMGDVVHGLPGAAHQGVSNDLCVRRA